MATAIVNIPFQEDLLQQIDQQFVIMGFRSRAELIQEANKKYINRKQSWQDIFSYDEKLVAKGNFTEDDVMSEIKSFRYEKILL